MNEMSPVRRGIFGLKHHSSLAEAAPAIRTAMMVGGLIALLSVIAAQGYAAGLWVSVVIVSFVWILAALAYLAHARMAGYVPASVGRTAETVIALAAALVIISAAVPWLLP